MYYDYYSAEHFMRTHQSEMLAAAQRARLARPTRLVPRLTLFVRALAVVGRALVTVGRRLESRAAAARTAAAAMYEEQHPAVGC